MEKSLEEYCIYKYNSIMLIKNDSGKDYYKFDFSDNILTKKRNPKLYEELSKNGDLLFSKIVNDFVEENSLVETVETAYLKNSDYNGFSTLASNGKMLMLLSKNLLIKDATMANAITMIKLTKCHDFFQKFKESLEKNDIYLLDIMGDINKSKIEFISGEIKQKYAKINVKEDVVNENKIISSIEYKMIKEILNLYIEKYKDNFNDLNLTYRSDDMHGLELTSTGPGNIIINSKELVEKLMEDQTIEELRTIISGNRRRK